MKVVAYVPMKLNNERLPDKNTKVFKNGKPLLTYILNTLSEVDVLDEVYAYCSNASVKEYLPSKVKYLTRDTNLDRSKTKINEVMTSFANDVYADIYVLAHATAPFVEAKSISDGVMRVKSGQHDSAFAVQALKEFMWLDGKPVNYDPQSIPRTQDLPTYYTETTGLYIYTRDLIINKGRRIGQNPYLIPVTKIEAIDINEPIDFTIAESVLNGFLIK